MLASRTRTPGGIVTLRLLTYLAPSLPEGLFDALAHHVADHLGVEVELRCDRTRSGPRPGEPEPFSDGEADVAFLCATSYVWLTERTPRPIELVGAAWVPTDPRAGGAPIYFGDLLTPVGGPASLHELPGRQVAYNDDVSLSGYHSLRLALAEAGIDPAQVRFVRSGSHLRSLERLVDGAVDAAAIDSNVWRRRSSEEPALASALVSIATLGPHPVQPAVVRADLGAPMREALRAALLDAHRVPHVAAALELAGFTRFLGVDHDTYEALRRQLAGRTLLEADAARPGRSGSSLAVG
jgi:ABC-type phosphate/phosphonate transport system substrate-binding protein